MKNRLTSLSKLCASELSVLIFCVMNKLLICPAEPAAPKLENVAPLIKDPPCDICTPPLATALSNLKIGQSMHVGLLLNRNNTHF